MDPQDLRRSQSSGNDGHGIHVCHKCGWPFPNPHPSSRHRRAHKKICGTIHGYTHNVDTHLGVSDGDHSDQEDFKTPGTKVVERSNEEKGSGVIGQGSIKSDDGIYSDAVTEFSDTSSPAMTGEGLEDVRGSAPNVETVAENRSNNNDGEIAGNQFQECLSTSHTHLKTRSISDDRNDSEGDLHPIKYEMVTYASEDIKINLATDSMIESSLASVEHGRGIQATNPDNNMNLPNKVPYETDEGVSKFEGTVELTSADEVHNINSGGFVESCKAKEEDNATNVHVLSVPDDIQVLEDPVAMVEDFKDHKGKKLGQVPSLDSTEQFDDKENDVKQPFVLEDFNIYPSSHLSGGNVVSSDADGVEPSCELIGCSEPMIKEVPVEDEATMSGNQSSDEKCNLSEDNNKRATEIFFPKVPASNLEPVICLSELRVNPVANLQQGGDAADDCQKDLTERCDIVGYDGNHEKAEKYTSSGERFTDKTTAETPTSLDSPNSLFELQVHPTNNLPYVDGSADHDGVGIETCVASVNESMEGPSEKNLSAESKLTPVSSINFNDPKTTVEDTMEDASSMKLDEARCNLLDSSSNFSIAGGKIVSDTQRDVLENEIACNDTVQIKAGASAAAGSDHGSSVGSFQTSLENTGMKEPGFSAKDTKSSEDNCSREFHAVAPEFTSQSLEENDDNLVRQQLNSSGIDVSVDSNSRTDSLDANWGSVSVLSMQSDAQAVIDAEMVPPTDSQASLEENTDMKKSKAASERHYSDKSDMFEAPSFMTLVENQGGDDNKATGPKIPTAVRNPEQSKTALQTGWFPSITNVVNESQGRKKNEEIIAKVTNWSTGKQHTPLKSLLGEASQESKGKLAKQNESLAPVPQNDDKTTKVPVTTTVNAILNPASPTDQAPKKENPKERNSPAKKPSDNKIEKKKVKGKPYWVHFVCCSSEN